MMTEAEKAETVRALILNKIKQAREAAEREREAERQGPSNPYRKG
jgi:hypothetical protein